MADVESWQTKVLRKNTEKLELALVPELRFVVNEMNNTSLLSDDELGKINLLVGDAQKAIEIVSIVKRLVKLYSNNFEKFVDILKKKPQIFETIITLLSSEYSSSISGQEEKVAGICSPTTPSPAISLLTTPSPATPLLTTPSPATPLLTNPSPATPSPATPSPATPSPAAPSPTTPLCTTPSPATPLLTLPSPSPTTSSPSPITSSPTIPSSTTLSLVTPSPTIPSTTTSLSTTPYLTATTPSPTALTPLPATSSPTSSSETEGKFSLLKTPKLSDARREELIRRLNIETDEMKEDFTALIATTLINLIGKGITVRNLRSALTNLNRTDGNKITEELKGMTDIDDAFMVFSKFWSFFQYDILSSIIKGFCKELKPELEEYTSSLKQYCERRVCEVPNGSGGKESEEEKIMRIQVDQTFNTEIARIKLENLKVLGSKLGKLLGTSLLIIEIIDGSIIISFKCLHEFDVIFPLCAKQEEELQKIGVTRIYSKNHEYFRHSPPLTETDIAMKHETQKKKLQYELVVEIKKGNTTTSKMEAWLKEGVDINYIYHNGESLLQAVSETGNVDLVKYLLDKGVKIDYQNSKGESSLYIASEKNHIEVVKTLLKFNNKAQVDLQKGDGWSSLMVASKNGQVEVVKILLENKAQIDLQNEDGSSSLMVACENGHVNVAKILLENKAQVNLQNNKGWPSLMMPSQNGHVDVVKMLIENKAQIELLNNNGWSSLMVASLNGHVDVVKMLIENKAQVNLQNNNGASSLIVASQNGHVNVVKMLIENKAQVNLQNNNGASSLIVASQNGHVDVVKMLIENKAKVDLQNNNGVFSLMVASKKNHVDVVKLLIESNAQINLQNNNGVSSLMFASQNGHADVVKLLLENRAHVNLQKNNGASSLMAGREKGHVDVVNMLIENRVQIDLQNNNGASSLMVGSENDHVYVVKMLIKNKVQIDLPRKDGWCPLMIASQNGHADVVKMLIEYKAQVDIQVRDGWSPLMIASQNGHADVVKLLIENKAQIDLQEKDGGSPLMFASQNGHVDVVKMLIENKVQVDLQEKDGWSPLMLASQNGHVDVVKMLIENKAQVNLQNNNGISSLMVASHNDHVNVVKMLLENEAQINLLTKEGWSPLMFASQYGHVDVVKMLIESKVDLQNTNGVSSLMIASQNGHTKVVNTENRAQVDVREENVWSSVIVAIQNGHVNVVNILLGNKTQVSSHDKGECTTVNAPPKCGDRVMFKVELFSTHTKDKESQSITFEGNSPVTIGTIKEKVEENFNIPVCVQSLSYDSCPLNDDASFEAMRIRSGDTLHITYPGKGNYREIKAIVTWFEQLRVFLLTEDPTISNRRFSLEFNDLLKYGMGQKLMEDVALKYFISPSYINQSFFVSCGGLKIVMDVYAALLRHPWNDCLIVLKYVQNRILSMLWNLSCDETTELCRLIVSHNGLELCIQSLLREKVVAGEYIMDKPYYSENHRHRDTSSKMLVENIRGALGLLRNLSALPELHLKIARSNDDCMDQLSNLTLTPSVGISSVLLVGIIFLCIAYTPETHSYLAKPHVIERLLKGCSRYSQNDDVLILKYVVQVFLAQIILVSPQLIPKDLQQQIHDFMADFLQNATYQDIMERLIKRNYIWTTLVPYVKLLYHPSSSSSGLNMFSLQTILLSLQYMLGREVHMKILLREGLEDFITCSPSYVPESLKPQAKEMVQIVGSGMELQPPKLVNLAKAKLAKMYFGLERVMNTEVGGLISAVSP